MLCALGVVPATPLIDTTMEATLLHVRNNWQWDSAWGWDFPAMAMTAARVGRPDLAVESLFMDSEKNRYLPTGHTRRWAATCRSTFRPTAACSRQCP
jgi:hypothetical protein